MSLLPEVHTYMCDCCAKVFESEIKLNSFGYETNCPACEQELKKEKFKDILADLDKQIKKQEYIDEQLYINQNGRTINFELRGDDLQMIKKIKRYSSIENEDVYSWLCYLENEIKEQIK